MKRLATAILMVALALPVGTAVANDQVCTTAEVDRTAEGQPHLFNVHYAESGVRIMLVGDFLWTQYETTSNPSEGGEVLSTELGPDVIAVEACPDGTISLTLAAPTTDEVEIGETVIVHNVIDYWQGMGYQVYGPR